MLSIRNINPMVRAVGTMGAVAALVGGVTFAGLTSNPVKLTANTLTSATASLEIGSNSQAYSPNSVNGLTATLVPGIPASFTFYLNNVGQSAMNITASVPTNVSVSDIPASDITLGFNCGNGSVAYTLDQWAAGSAAIPGNPLPAGSTWTCTETATLTSAYTGSGGQNVIPFDVEFIGNQ
jgi:hypothetical protein